MCSDKNDFPAELYRGISIKDCKTEEGYVLPAVFQFEEYDESRGDDFCELSINWNDDEGALVNLSRAKKENKEGELEQQFKYGYCMVNKAAIDLAFKTFMDDNVFDYERRIVREDKEKNIPENPYHGNLLIIKNIEPGMKKNFVRTLATIAGRVLDWGTINANEKV